MIKLIRTTNEALKLGFNPDYVGKVVDINTRQVVGYVADCTPKNKLPDNCFCTKYVFIFTDFMNIRVFGNNLVSALAALGLGDRYEERYGDRKDILFKLKTNPKKISIVRISREVVTVGEIQTAIDELAENTSEL